MPQIKIKTHLKPQDNLFNTCEKGVFPLFTENSIMTTITTTIITILLLLEKNAQGI